jgi:uncharacterized protein YjbI with pentapeptide repeats
MAFGRWRARTAALSIGLTVAAGSLAVIAWPASAAVTCPAVSAAFVVTPAPTPGVDWAGCDLNAADLAGSNLTGADLTGADLNSADLSSADLANANLTDADLGDANFSAAVLTDAVLTGADVRTADFAGAGMTGVASGGLTGVPTLPASNWAEIDGYLVGAGANLDGADLAGADLANLALSDTVLTSANLTGADLTSTSLAGSSLDGATLTNADLTGATLTGADIAGTTFTGAVLYGVISGGLTGSPSALPANWHVVGTKANVYLIGPGADLRTAPLGDDTMSDDDLRGANLDGADLGGADLTGADLTGANLAGVTGAEINFDGADLASAQLQDAQLDESDLDDANLTDADLTGADLTSTTASDAIWTGATCPDGTPSDLHAPVGCTGPLNTTPPAAKPAVTAGTKGAHGWYTSPVTVSWHWTDAGQINQNACTTSSKTSGNGSRTLTATCTDMAGNKATASYQVKTDTTKPAVSVTGVTKGARYVFGKVPAARCATIDSISGVSTKATVTITATGKNGTGAFTASCAGAVSVAGAVQAAPVRVRYTVVYGFGGFIAPVAKSTLKKSAPTFTVEFRLTSAAGTPIAAGLANALATAHHVRVTLRGPGIAASTATCAWSTAGKVFRCTGKTPKAIETGRAHPYTITAYENAGPGFVAAPAITPAANPETIYFH